jgi:predicted transcriptional regulator
VALGAKSFRLDIEIKARMQRLAATRRRSLDWLMGEAIREYVERKERRGQLR